METRIANIILSGLMVLSIPLILYGQEEPLATRMDVSCIQELDKDVLLTAKLRAKDGRSYVPVKGETIAFMGLQNEDFIDLGSASTNENGDALITVQNLNQLSLDEDGYYTISASYDGSDKYEENEEEFMFKRGYLEIKTSDEDGTKTVEISVYTIEDDARIPIEEVEARVGVPMMFSNLTIGSDYTNEEGILEFEFPNDLPGDEQGNLTLVAEVPDADDFGVLKATQIENWGIPKAVVAEKTRTLWSPNAPLWMVITFTILMLAVWGHFIYIIYRLYLMSKEGKMALQE